MEKEQNKQAMSSRKLTNQKCGVKEREQKLWAIDFYIVFLI